MFMRSEPLDSLWATSKLSRSAKVQLKVIPPPKTSNQGGPVKNTLTSIAHLGSGELLARVCSIATLGMLGHRYGAAIVGIFALAQGVAQYLQPLIDFGMRHIGARLVAQYPGAISMIVQVVQKRRQKMLVVA